MSQSKDILIAVMGATGTGKSSFIRLVTGDNKIQVGTGLQSATRAIATYRLSYQGLNYVLIDTPGLDDTTLHDDVILSSITEWLTQSYLSGTKLNGILYLHRIIDPRMQGSALRNFKMFRGLCGTEFQQQVLLGTTFWSSMKGSIKNKVIAEGRQQQLISTVWADMIKQGSEAITIPDDKTQALKLLLKFSAKPARIMQTQKEIVHQETDPSNTSAAIGLRNSELETEVAANRRETTEAAEIHRQTLEAISKKRIEEEQRLAMKEEVRLLGQQVSQMSIEFDFRLKEQDMKWREELVRRQLEQTNAMKRNIETQRLEREAANQDLIRKGRIKSLLNQLHKSQADETMKCSVVKAQGAVISKCDRCDIEIRGIGNFVCSICRAGNFDLCDSCHSKGRGCLTKAHKLSWKAAQSYSQRSTAPCKHRGNEVGREVICDRCDKKVLQVYLHCCQCKDDNFDLCIDCASSGKTCDNWWFSNHEMLIYTR